MAYLKEIRFNWDKVDNRDKYPFNMPSILNLKSIALEKNVTFFVGENGSGKSTLLEAVAAKCGFGIKGGSRNSLLFDDIDNLSLSYILSLSWLPKMTNGFFLRAETLYDFASYIDEVEASREIEKYSAYGGESLHSQSHGEAILSLLKNRFGSRGIYILDEPEAALSPQNQLAFLRIIWEIEKSGRAQFLIATHSPILMAYPNADIYNFDMSPISKIKYEETDHYQITRGFLNNPKKILTELFIDAEI